MSTRVVYLVGAGASHACVERVGSPHGILMRDLTVALSLKLQELIASNYSGDDSLANLVNSFIDETTDFEQIITFLDDAPSLRHRQFADEMRRVFEEVLRDKLGRIREETQEDPIGLYKVLVDMYNIDHFPEHLEGIITTNYDEYIEQAIEEVNDSAVDFGIRVEPSPQEPHGLRVLKLHGSFGWQDTWPISRGYEEFATLWIPPGIQKSKQAYPFNVLWGLAREMLSCDVLRVIGCRLSSNDWDLISLLFAMRHVNLTHRPQIEVIDSPIHVERLKETYPYLEVVSMLEVEPIGSQLVTEFIGGQPRRFAELKKEERQHLLESAGCNRNWFDLWLRQKVESMSIELESISTTTGLVEKFLND